MTFEGTFTFDPNGAFVYEGGESKEGEFVDGEFMEGGEPYFPDGEFHDFFDPADFGQGEFVDTFNPDAFAGDFGDFFQGGDFEGGQFEQYFDPGEFKPDEFGSYFEFDRSILATSEASPPSARLS